MGVTRTLATSPGRDGDIGVMENFSFGLSLTPTVTAHARTHPGATLPSQLFILWRLEAARGSDGGTITRDQPGCIVHLLNLRMNSKAATESIREQETLNPDELHPSSRQAQGLVPHRASTAAGRPGRDWHGAAARSTEKLRHDALSFQHQSWLLM